MHALVPVKTFSTAKQRLGDELRPEECAALARYMLDDVLNALEASPHVDTITLVGDDDETALLAQERRCRFMQEAPGAGLSRALDAAAGILAADGERSVLIVPADIPALSAADLDALAVKSNAALSLCPAARDGGTNALICSPPDVISFRFGPDSARKHLQAAREAGVSFLIIQADNIAHDIDTPDDLRWLLQHAPHTCTADWLRRSGIAARLDNPRLGATA